MFDLSLVQADGSEEAAKHTSTQAATSIASAEYFVKWKDKSYMHCSWISHRDLWSAMKQFPGLKMRWQRFTRSTKTPHPVSH